MNHLIIKKRGRPKGTTKKSNPHISIPIDLTQVGKLDKLNIDPKMLEIMKGDDVLDTLISYEGGLPRASNIMLGGEAGVGKTTILLDYLSRLASKGHKCLFISAEMGRKQMFKYTQRFPQFGIIDTLFAHDYLSDNMKDVFEQILDVGYEVVLIDSAVEVFNTVRDSMDWDRREAEKWFVSTCIKNNNGGNKLNIYTSFLAIQQLNVSNGEFVGGGKLKYLFDSAYKFIKDKESGETYIVAEKNRDGEVGKQLFYELYNDKINYLEME